MGSLAGERAAAQRVRYVNGWPGLVGLLLSLSLAGCGGGSSSTSSTTATPSTSTTSTASGSGFTQPDRGSQFAFVSRVAVTSCPDPNWCNSGSPANSTYWPTSGEGHVYEYTISETRSQGFSGNRTAWVYIPDRVTGPSPLLVYLHGGNGSGLKMFAKTQIADLSDGRGAAGISWQQNSATCQYMPTNYLTGTFADPATGNSCTSYLTSSFTNSQGMVVVFPDGISDLGATDNTTRHWEDGRSPSPGQGGTDTEQRDDVGFINFLINQIKTYDASVIDPSRVYIAGQSNGGMMTIRLAANAQDPAYTELNKVAAFGVLVASMPYNIKYGLLGREAFPSSGTHPFGIVFFVGNNKNTLFSEPECSTYSFPIPACASTVNGDGFMPYGSLGGGPYYINSPDLGQVISSPDDWNSWETLLESVTGTAPTTSSQSIGYFTTKTTYTFGAAASRMTVYETLGGLHLMDSSRDDFNFNARVWSELSDFKRNSDGTLVYSPSGYVGGTY